MTGFTELHCPGLRSAWQEEESQSHPREGNHRLAAMVAMAAGGSGGFNATAALLCLRMSWVDTRLLAFIILTKAVRLDNSLRPALDLVVRLPTGREMHISSKGHRNPPSEDGAFLQLPRAVSSQLVHPCRLPSPDDGIMHMS